MLVRAVLMIIVLGGLSRQVITLRSTIPGNNTAQEWHR